MRLFLLFTLLLNIFLSSCKKNTPAEEAFFIKIGNVSVAPEPKQGSGSHKITELWLYVNGKFQGAYPLGHLMPVINKNEKVKINIFAGIKNNGIANTRIFWQVYSLIEFDTLVESGKTIERDFTFKYNPFAVIAWNEGFENQTGYTIKKSPISATNFKITSAENSFEGKSIEMYATADSTIAQIESTTSFSLPAGNSNVYLELNYKASDEFLVGLLTDNNELKGALNVLPQGDWNKIYIQLASAVSQQPTSPKYRVFFRLLKRDVENPRVFLDNIKIVYL